MTTARHFLRPTLAATPYPFCASLVKQIFVIPAVLILFLGGLALGRYAVTTWPDPGNWFGSDQPLQVVVLARLQSELNLTPSQVARLTPIIASACSDLRLLSEERRAQRLSVYDEICATITPCLSDFQQQRLASLQAEWQHRPSTRSDQRIVSLF